MRYFFSSRACSKWILGLPFFHRLVTLPLDEPAAHRVVLQLIQSFAAREQLRRHRVRMVELALGSIEDDIFQRQIESAGTDRHLVGLVGMGG